MHSNPPTNLAAKEVEAIEVTTLPVEIQAEIIDISRKMEITGEITEMTEITEMKRNPELTTAQGQNMSKKKLEMTRKNKKRQQMELKRIHTKRWIEKESRRVKLLLNLP